MSHDIEASYAAIEVVNQLLAAPVKLLSNSSRYPEPKRVCRTRGEARVASR